MFVKPDPLSTCHCTVGAGVPVAAAVNVTVAPAQRVCDVGFVVTAGGMLIVRIAAVVVVVPHTFVKTARY